ncbi:hypothetical protein Zm00014a_028751 [Zea mays]|uniref:Bifunctional inhibitor/plant lipid transfer protein/seed storage helical domain-containing protein n=1 Tax=Zea mays TaxID=4577 RepID=A0A3L6FRD4_MAIZE|nr:hypothetical protein Zm00014a_028751 [Zea mays]
MTTKAIIQLLFFALVFATFTAHGAWGEKGCYDEKERFKRECSTSYERPSKSCCDTVRSVDMACVRRTMTSEEEKGLSVRKISFLSMDCNNSVRVVGKKYGEIPKRPMWQSFSPPPPHRAHP